MFLVIFFFPYKVYRLRTAGGVVRRIFKLILSHDDERKVTYIIPVRTGFATNLTVFLILGVRE